MQMALDVRLRNSYLIQQKYGVVKEHQSVHLEASSGCCKGRKLRQHLRGAAEDSAWTGLMGWRGCACGCKT